MQTTLVVETSVQSKVQDNDAFILIACHMLETENEIKYAYLNLKCTMSKSIPKNERCIWSKND